VFECAQPSQRENHYEVYVSPFAPIFGTHTDTSVAYLIVIPFHRDELVAKHEYIIYDIHIPQWEDTSDNSPTSIVTDEDFITYSNNFVHQTISLLIGVVN
jgi:hypothetical protein